jgi:hypothetical protein
MLSVLVLDITYRKPTQFGATVEVSFLAEAYQWMLYLKIKWSAITCSL